MKHHTKKKTTFSLAKGGLPIALAALLLGGTLMSTPSWAGSFSYSYDTLGRVTQVVYNDGSKTTTLAYKYDAAGNRTTVVTTKSP